MHTECENAPNVKIKSKSVFHTTSVSCRRTYSRASELSIYTSAWERHPIDSSYLAHNIQKHMSMHTYSVTRKDLCTLSTFSSTYRHISKHVCSKDPTQPQATWLAFSSYHSYPQPACVLWRLTLPHLQSGLVNTASHTGLLTTNAEHIQCHTHR